MAGDSNTSSISLALDSLTDEEKREKTEGGVELDLVSSQDTPRSRTRKRGELKIVPKIGKMPPKRSQNNLPSVWKKYEKDAKTIQNDFIKEWDVANKKKLPFLMLLSVSILVHVYTLPPIFLGVEIASVGRWIAFVQVSPFISLAMYFWVKLIQRMWIDLYTHPCGSEKAVRIGVIQTQRTTARILRIVIETLMLIDVMLIAGLQLTLVSPTEGVHPYFAFIAPAIAVAFLMFRSLFYKDAHE